MTILYGPDDKSIVPEYAKALKGVREAWYKKSVLKMLESKFHFTDWWGPTLYDARGNQIEWPGRPMVPVKTGRTIKFYRGSDNSGYNQGPDDTQGGSYPTEK